MPRWLRAVRKARPELGQRWINLGYGEVPLRVLAVNWFFQRALRLNSSAPFSVNFRSTISGGAHIRLGLRVGANLALSGGLYVTGERGIDIGDGTFIAPNVAILTANHDIYDRRLSTQEGPVTIGRNCWLGFGSIILPGVSLGDNVTVAAGAVVTRSFPSDVVVGGIPAQVILLVNEQSISEFRKRNGINQVLVLPAVNSLGDSVG